MSKKHVLQVYKALMRECRMFPAYNFRMYALRKVKDGFKENKHLSDTNAINIKLEEASKNLKIIKRQVIIGQLYMTDKLVIENVPSQK